MLAKAHSSSAMARSVPCCSSSFEQPSTSVSRGVMNQPISHLRGSVVSWLKAQPPHRSRGKLLTTRSSNSTQQATMTRPSASSSTLTKEVDLSEGDLSTVPQDDSASPSNSIVHDARSSLSKSTTSSSGDIASWPKPEVHFVSSEGGWQTVRGTLMLPVHADDVYAILTDYGGSAQIFQNISASQLVVSESGSAELVQVRAGAGRGSKGHTSCFAYA